MVSALAKLEYPQPRAEHRAGPRTLRDEDQLWAFGGTRRLLRRSQRILLEVDIVRYCLGIIASMDRRDF